MEKARQHSLVTAIAAAACLVGAAACGQPEPAPSETSQPAEDVGDAPAAPEDGFRWTFAAPSSPDSAGTLTYGHSASDTPGAAFDCRADGPLIDVVLNRGDSSDRVVTLTSGAVSSTLPMSVSNEVHLLVGQLPKDDPVLNRFIETGELTYEVEAGEAQYSATSDADRAAIAAFSEACGL